MNKFVLDKVYADKKAYVEQTLGAMLKPMYSFGSIKYARDAITNEEYVKIRGQTGITRQSLHPRWNFWSSRDSDGLLFFSICILI